MRKGQSCLRDQRAGGGGGEFQFSESYTANLHFSTLEESIQFVMAIDSAFENYSKKHLIHFY